MHIRVLVVRHGKAGYSEPFQDSHHNTASASNRVSRYASRLPTRCRTAWSLSVDSPPYHGSKLPSEGFT